MKPIIGIALVATLGCGESGQDSSHLTSAVEEKPCTTNDECEDENPCNYDYCLVLPDESSGSCMHSEGNVVSGCCWAPPVDPVSGKPWSQEERSFQADSQCDDKCGCTAPDFCDQDLAECKAGPPTPGCYCGEGPGGCEVDSDCVEDGNLCNGILSGKCGVSFAHQCEWLTGPVGWNCKGHELGTCTTNACEMTTGLCEEHNLPDSVPCWDNDPCTINDHCDGKGNCVGTLLPSCLPEVSEVAPDEPHETQPEVVAVELYDAVEVDEPSVELLDEAIDPGDEPEPFSPDEGITDAGQSSGGNCSGRLPAYRSSGLPLLLLSVCMAAVLSLLGTVTRRRP